MVKSIGVKDAAKKSYKLFLSVIEMLIGILLIVSLINVIIKPSYYKYIFSDNIFLDSIIGSLVGSVSTGIPMISYVLGGEFLNQGISLIAVTAFLVSWVTVGIVQLPLEISLLGKRFAITRNIFSFIFSIIVAMVTVTIVNIL
jgi:uncharacterized membrane protein YraQ (UPF0718 family)